MESHLKQAVLGIVTFAAAGAGQIAAPRSALAIVVLGHREGGAATARHEKHAEGLGLLRGSGDFFGFRSCGHGPCLELFNNGKRAPLALIRL